VIERIANLPLPLLDPITRSPDFFFDGCGRRRRRDMAKKTKEKDSAAKARSPGEEHRRVSVDFPAWVVEALNKEARRLGVTRQSVIKVWIAERLSKPPF
jgi:hypothetical protein